MSEIHERIKSLLKRVPASETPEIIQEFLAKQREEFKEETPDREVDMFAFMRLLAYSGERERHREAMNRKNFGNKTVRLSYSLESVRRELYKSFYSVKPGDDVVVQNYYYAWRDAQITVHSLEYQFRDNLNSPFMKGVMAYKMKKLETDNPFNRETEYYKYHDWFKGWHKERRTQRHWLPEEWEYEPPETE